MTRNLGVTTFVVFSSIMPSIFLRDQLKTKDDQAKIAFVITIFFVGVVLIAVGFVMIVYITMFLLFGVVWVVLGIVAFFMKGEAVFAESVILPLSLFLLWVSLLSFSFSPLQRKNILAIIGLGLFFILLSIGNLGWNSLWAFVFALFGYFRLLENALLFNLNLILSLPFISRFRPSPVNHLKLLPPYSTEIYWYEIHQHDQILANAFQEDSNKALAIYQKMQTFSLPGYESTLKSALPLIVSRQLANVTTIEELIFTATSQHSVLPFLIAPFYYLESESENLSSDSSLPKVASEISILLPRLQSIVNDIQSASEQGNLALKERSYERILNRLSLLEAQLLTFGLKPREVKRWQPVLKRWQNIIQQEIEELSKQSQGESLNPFNFGNPLKANKDKLFKGRQQFADNVVRLILDQNRPTLVLYAPRRFGKTSFLYNLPRLFPSDIISVFVDMQSAAIIKDESAFCYGLVRAIFKDSRTQGLKLPDIPDRKDFQKDAYNTLEDWLDIALRELNPEERILINLDEFEKIGTAIAEGKLNLQLFDELRHLIQHYEQLAFLFSGVQTLEELGPNWSSYFISVVPMKMLYLELHEAKELLINPDPDFTLTYDEGIVESILKLTRCQPYLVQLIGWCLVNQANLNKTKRLSADLMPDTIEDALINGEPYFDNVWREFTGTTPEEIKAGQKLLLTIAKENIPQPLSQINEIEKRALQKLLRFHILEEINGNYEFEIPLMKMWVSKK